MMRNPFFTFINVAGLSVGFAVFFVLWQYGESELNSEKQWKNWERIVRCGFIWRWTDDGKIWSHSQFGEIWPEVAKQVSEDYPEIEEMTRVFRQENFTPEHIPFHGKDIFLTRLNERGELISFKETALVYADPNLFQFFDIPVTEGDPSKMLSEINSIVLSEKLARRYFGDQSPLNQTLLINNEIALKVTGVYPNLPHNTHFEFEAVLSTRSIDRFITLTQYAMGGAHTYFRLNPGTTTQSLEKKINDPGVYWHHWKEKIRDGELITKAEFHVQPLIDIPFSSYRWDYFKVKSKYFLSALGWVGLFTLLIAWINYIQLATSFYIKRLKEMGVRKTNGARTLDFAKQFFIESTLINAMAILLAATLIQLSKIPLQNWLGFYIKPWQHLAPSVLFLTGAVTLAGIAFTALLPVLYFRMSSPRSLFNKTRSLSSNVGFVKGLVVVQFCFSIVLLVWTFTVQRQVNHVLTADYGLNYQSVALLDLPQIRNSSFTSDLNVLQERLKAEAGVEEVTSFTNITGDADNNMICLETLDGESNGCMDTNGGVTENFISFFNLKMLAGRNFNANLPVDSATVILSRKAIERLGMKSPSDAIGKRITVNTGTWTNWNNEQAEIIGVVEDYMGGNASFLINEGMGNGHAGIILTYKDQFIPSSKPRKLAVRINGSRFYEANQMVEKIYREIFPGQLYRFNFLDDQVAHFYDGERTARNQILLFTIIAIGIACLGLLGMISNKVVEKTKEIGIRKVLGAQIHQIAQILLNTTVQQIMVATVIAIPLAWYIAQQYLQKFSERIDLQWWHFALPVMMLVLIMMATVLVVIWKAAVTNPVEALKHE